jgi:hypothetical protein
MQLPPLPRYFLAYIALLLTLDPEESLKTRPVPRRYNRDSKLTECRTTGVQVLIPVFATVSYSARTTAVLVGLRRPELETDCCWTALKTDATGSSETLITF